MWETIMIVVAAAIGFLSALFVTVAVLPKQEALSLPMPRLPSYLLGHAGHFINAKSLVRTNMRWFRELGEVFQIWLVHKRVVVSANPEDVVQILGRPNIFSRPAAQTALFNDLQPDNFQTMSREVHRRHRKRLREAFNEKSLEGFSKVISQTIGSLIRRIDAYVDSNPGKAMNFTPHLADTTLAVLLEAALGSKMTTAQRRNFAKDANLLLTDLYKEYLTYPLPRLFSFLGIRKRLFRQNIAVRKFCEDLIRMRLNESGDAKKNRQHDLLDMILDLDPDNIAQQVTNTTMFAIAGFESSSEAISWTIYEICGNPEVERKVVAEVEEVFGDKDEIDFDDVRKFEYLRQVWKEALRMYPAAGFLLRKAEKDTVLPGSGVFVPKGLQVAALIAGSQRNANYVSRPDEFWPDRWAEDVEKEHRPHPAVFTPFSCGVERCPGQFFADFEAIMVLAYLYRKYKVSLGCKRGDVVSIADWAQRARSPDPKQGKGDLSWTLPVLFKPKTAVARH